MKAAPVTQVVFHHHCVLTSDQQNNIITSVYCIFIVSLRVLSVGVALALCVGVPLLGVDLADPPVVEGTLTTPALLLPPESSGSYTPPARPWTPVRGEEI